MRPPRVSILIPNFNNGRQSSKSGQQDLIGNLLRSLRETLQNDPTPFEVIAYDDGSTDDSLATLREWSAMTWPGGRPFLELTEAEHCGYLSRVANILSRKARGEILVRLDGDITCLTPNWVASLCEVFDRGPARLGIVAPKQLRPDGRIHACGDFVLHPAGYTHVGSGLPRDAMKHTLEVDHAMGCFHCMKKEVFADVGGYDEAFLRGQTEDLGLRARLKGWRCFAVPHIEFVHFHTVRMDRNTEADSDEGIDKTLRIFFNKWGFCRLAPDLDVARRKYAGTPLLWNARWFGKEATPPAKPATALPASEWGRYPTDPELQKRVNLRAGVLLDVIKQAGRPRCGVIVGAGEGLISHMLALRGVSLRGFDAQPVNVELARRCVRNQKYAGPDGVPTAPPRFEPLADVRRLPLADGEADFLVINNQLEVHPNPVALINEAKRALSPGGLLVIFSRRKVNTGDPSDPATEVAWEHRYQWIELLNQVQATRGWDFLVGARGDDPSRDMVVAVRKQGAAEADVIAPPAALDGAVSGAQDFTAREPGIPVAALL
jgi:GT2 family glycosyltransferase/SAM-dependent methyltransferase